MEPGEKTALITGAGRGIGRAIAVQLAKAGNRVYASARSRQELEDLQAEIKAQSGNCKIFVVDLSDRKQVVDWIEEIKSDPVSILVNNAGIGSSQDPRPLVEFDDSFWDLTFEVNVRAPYLLTKHLLPFMLENGFGRIINISSINAKVPALHGAAYTASKHAIAGLTKSTALEIAGTGVTANAICPGVTATQMNDLRIQYDAERTHSDFKSVEEKTTPYGRRLTPVEIAPLAAFLASNEAAGINGQLINVCGGTVMA